MLKGSSLHFAMKNDELFELVKDEEKSPNSPTDAREQLSSIRYFGGAIQITPGSRSFEVRVESGSS